MKIAVFAYSGMTLFHLSAPLLVFGEVGAMGLAESWDCRVFSADGQPIRTAEGLVIADLSGPAVAQGADIVILPSWHTDFRPASPELLADLRRWHDAGSTIAGFCLGAFPLLESGILRGRTAVTHWQGLEVLASRHGSEAVVGDALYLDHDDVLTSAGTASAFDACLHLVRKHLGQEAATKIARQLVLAPHREGGQAQFIETPVDRSIEGQDDALAAFADRVRADLGRQWGVAEMAEAAHMSARNFSRRFSQKMGMSPARWLKQERLIQARRLLETTDLSVEQVALASGFASVVTFRQGFVAAFGTTPTSYRRRFAA